MLLCALLALTGSGGGGEGSFGGSSLVSAGLLLVEPARP